MNKKYFFLTIFTHLILYFLGFFLPFIWDIWFLYDALDFLVRSHEVVVIIPFALIFITGIAGAIWGRFLLKQYPHDAFVWFGVFMNVVSFIFIFAFHFLARLELA